VNSFHINFFKFIFYRKRKIYTPIESNNYSNNKNKGKLKENGADIFAAENRANQSKRDLAN